MAPPDPGSPLTTRAATAADVDAVTETIALAFYSDPVWGWAFPDPERRLDQHRAVWGFGVESAVGHGWVRMLDGAAATALWIPPGEPELGPGEEERFEALVEELLGADAALALDTFGRFDRARPTEPPHFYLSMLATHPDHRGKGLGMGLLADSLARIDALGAPAYLESTNPANHRRYEGVGFSRWGEFGLAGDGPDVMQMWRDPR